MASYQVQYARPAPNRRLKPARRLVPWRICREAAHYASGGSPEPLEVTFPTFVASILASEAVSDALTSPTRLIGLLRREFWKREGKNGR